MRGWSVIWGGWGDRRGVSVDMKISARGARPSLFELPVALPGHHVSLRARDEVRQIANTIIIIREQRHATNTEVTCRKRPVVVSPMIPRTTARGRRRERRTAAVITTKKLRGCEANVHAAADCASRDGQKMIF